MDLKDIEQLISKEYPDYKIEKSSFTHNRYKTVAHTYEITVVLREPPTIPWVEVSEKSEQAGDIPWM